MLGFYEGPRITLMSSSRVVFAPRWLTPEYHETSPPVGRVIRYPSFMACAEDRRPRRICFWRTYALGDILMLLPIVRVIRRRLELTEPVRIVVQERHRLALRPLEGSGEFIFMRKMERFRDYGADLHFNLDSCLEVDHRGGPASNLHRLELYGRALGVEVRCGACRGSE